MDDSDEKRAKSRFRISIPAVMRDTTGGVLTTGILEDVSGSGARLTNTTGTLELGTRGILRLMDLSLALRTVSADTIELKAEVVRKEMGGYALRFLDPAQDLEELLDRAMGRRAIVPTNE